jgi:hypothetical protein
LYAGALGAGIVTAVGVAAAAAGTFAFTSERALGCEFVVSWIAPRLDSFSSSEGEGLLRAVPAKKQAVSRVDVVQQPGPPCSAAAKLY